MDKHDTGTSIVAFFEDLRDYIKLNDGYIDLEDNIGSLGYWIAAKDGTADGIEVLELYLDIHHFHDLVESYGEYWHNDHFDDAFTDARAYGVLNAFLTVDGVIDEWINFGHKLQQIGE